MKTNWEILVNFNSHDPIFSIALNGEVKQENLATEKDALNAIWLKEGAEKGSSYILVGVNKNGLEVGIHKAEVLKKYHEHDNGVAIYLVDFTLFDEDKNILGNL